MILETLILSAAGTIVASVVGSFVFVNAIHKRELEADREGRERGPAAVAAKRKSLEAQRTFWEQRKKEIIEVYGLVDAVKRNEQFAHAERRLFALIEMEAELYADEPLDPPA